MFIFLYQNVQLVFEFAFGFSYVRISALFNQNISLHYILFIISVPHLIS